MNEHFKQRIPLYLAIAFCVLMAFFVFKKFMETKSLEQRIALQEKELQTKTATFNAATESLDRATKDARLASGELKGDMRDARDFRDSVMRASARSGAVGGAIASAQPAKMSVTEHFMSHGEWPKNNEEAGLYKPTDYALGHIQSVTLEPAGTTAAVRVRFLDESKASKSVVLTAYTNPAGQVGWTCSSPDVADISKYAADCANKK
jgi:type IV pilus assembly protein PilA